MGENLNTTEPVGYEWYYTLSSVTNGVPSNSSSHGWAGLGNNTRTGSQNPRWKDLCRAGLNATTGFSGTLFTGDTDRSFWSYSARYNQTVTSTGGPANQAACNGSGFILYPYAPSQFSPPSSVVTDVHNRCIRAYIAEVISAQSSENLTGRSIKHFQHDVHSLIHPMSGIQAKIQSYLTSLKKVGYGKLKGPSLLSVISSSYLEFKFGVQPFVDDVSAIVADMVIRDRKRNPSVPIQASASSRFAGSQSAVQLTGSGCPLGPYMNMSSTSTYSERMKGAVRTGINDDGKLGVLQDNRLLPSDWAPTIFSILPYAWMVNYFTNIRDIIDAASLRYSDLVWGCLTTRNESTVSYGDVYLTADMISPFPGRTLVFSKESDGGSATFSWKQCTRTALSPSTLVPSFEFKIPTTPTPWVNMMAAFAGPILKIVSSFT